MRRWLKLFCLYLALIVTLVFLATPPDPEVADVKIQFVYERY